MSKPPPKKSIVTDGDAKVNVVNALGDLTLVSSRLLRSITHLHNFMSESLNQGTQKRVILKQIGLIQRASDFLHSRVEYVKTQSGVRSLSSRAESRKRASTILDNKINGKVNKKNRKNYIHLDDEILAQMVKKKQLFPRQRNHL